MGNLERFKRSLEQRKRCAHAELDLPPCPRGVGPALYKPVARYVAGQPIVHPNFGKGVVLQVWDGKIAVYFEGYSIINLIAHGREEPPPVLPTTKIAKPPPKPKPAKKKAAKKKPKKLLSMNVSELKERNRRGTSAELCPKCGHLLDGQLHQMTCGEKEFYEP